MDKIIKLDDLSKHIKQIKNRRETIVLAGGCFDILHPGHVEFLTEAKKLGNSLIIALESDETVRRLKGPFRPIHIQMDRAYILSNLTAVDFIILLPVFTTDQEYSELVKTVKPDIIAITKGDSIQEKKKRQSKEVGAKLIEITKREGHSTKNITDKLKLPNH